MSEKEEKAKSAIVKREEGIPTQMPDNLMHIGKGIPIDLTGMTEQQIQVLKEHHTKRMMDIASKKFESEVDTETLDNKLGIMAKHITSLGKEGASVTITDTFDDSIGRTEFIGGIRSKRAEEGKLSRSQAGLTDLYPLWIGVGVFIIIVIAIIVKMR